jgi:intraflagellar transport protein 140
MFSAPEGILLQESHPIPAGFEALLGLSVPSLYVCKKAAAAEGGGVCFSVTMRDFLGMEQVDAATKNSLLEFNFHLATNNQDDAFKAVKMIKNPGVWENMVGLYDGC